MVCKRLNIRFPTCRGAPRGNRRGGALGLGVATWATGAFTPLIVKAILMRAT
jgi:hypothetical protein